MPESLDTKELTLKQLIMEVDQFVVPSHQRDYSWSKDHINDLFVDIQGARDASQREYFFGLMVFKQESDGRLMILDGQQRIATSIIILEIVSDRLRELRHVRDAERIHENYVTHFGELGETVGRPKLILNNNNNTKFSEYVINSQTRTDLNPLVEGLGKYDPNRALLESIMFCNEKINEIASEGRNRDEKVHRLLAFANYLLGNVRVIRFVVPTLSNAYRVFETLNDRGLDLSILDLIKNYLFDLADQAGHLRDIEHTWSQLSAHLVQISGEEFLKTFWASRYGSIRGSQLFDNFASTVSSWDDASRVSEDMLRAAEKYEGLENADDTVWAELPESAKNSVRALRIMGARQIHSILLSALERLQRNQLERLLWLLEVFIVRYQLIGSGRTGTLETASSNVAKRIFDRDIRTANDVRLALQDLFPSDQAFKTAFVEKQETQSAKIRYIFYKLEVAARTSSHADLGVELVPDNTLTIEHVLPKRPGAHWQSLLAQDENLQRQCLNRLGNICLLDRNINRSLGNRSFSQKRDLLRASSLILTGEIGTDYQVWTRDSIEARQRHMADLAAAVWSFS